MSGERRKKMLEHYVLITMRNDEPWEVFVFLDIEQAKQRAWSLAQRLDPWAEDFFDEWRWAAYFAFRCLPGRRSELLEFYELAIDNDQFRAIEAELDKRWLQQAKAQ